MAGRCKKAKAAGREQHRQLLNAKKNARKQKKNVTLPARFRKNKR
jgi:hypothetical protein